MSKYYIQEDGKVRGGTVQFRGDHTPPENGFVATPQQEEDIKRWLAAGKNVYWNEGMGPHLDPTRDPPAPTITPAPAIPTPETANITPHASEAAFELVLDSLVLLLDPNATTPQKTTRYAALKAKVNAFKQSLED